MLIIYVCLFVGSLRIKGCENLGPCLWPAQLVKGQVGGITGFVTRIPPFLNFSILPVLKKLVFPQTESVSVFIFFTEKGHRISWSQVLTFVLLCPRGHIVLTYFRCGRSQEPFYHKTVRFSRVFHTMKNRNRFDILKKSISVTTQVWGGWLVPWTGCWLNKVGVRIPTSPHVVSSLLKCLSYMYVCF